MAKMMLMNDEIEGNPKREVRNHGLWSKFSERNVLLLYSASKESGSPITLSACLLVPLLCVTF